MISRRIEWLIFRLVFVVLAAEMVLATSTLKAAAQSKKVFIVTDMEGVDGIFDFDLQCIPWKSPRWEESRKLLTGEINAAVDGLLDGGATEVVVVDSHTGGGGLSITEIHPKAKIITGLHSIP